MTYCTQTDIENKVGGIDSLIQLCDFKNSGATTMTVDLLSVMNAAIESAQATIDGYINKQVMVPLASPVPSTIKHMTARLAAYELRSARRVVDPETHGKVYEDDMQMLADIRDGVITLGVDPAPPKASARIDSQTDRPNTKARSRKNMAGFGGGGMGC